jgi:hypothetical protein
MQVMAFSSPSRPEWRWRIVTNDGEIVEESRQEYPSIGEATVQGKDRLRELDVKDATERTFALRRNHRPRKTSGGSGMMGR